MGYEEEDVSSYWVTLRKKERVQEIKRGSTRVHSVEIFLWKTVELSYDRQQ